MYQIYDDPIISCIERTGYPGWIDDDYDSYDDDDEEEEDE